MASKELTRLYSAVKNHIRSHPVEEAHINELVDLARCAYTVETDVDFGKRVSETAKRAINRMVMKATNGDGFGSLEEWSQENDCPVELIETYYNVLLLEAPHLVDSFKLYIEKNRRRRDRFYEPRRNTLIKVSNAIQRLEDDDLDILFLHQPPRTGKSGDLTMDLAWHCARNPEASNLYVTYKEGLGGAFLDGVIEVYTDPTYCFQDVFPDARIVHTDAKNNKLDLNRRKKYKSLSGKGLESGLNGEYDATGWLVVDDPLEGVQDVMSAEVLKRKQTIFDNNVLSRRKEHCKLVLMGTIWSLHDIFMNYMEYLENAAKDSRWDVIKIPALDEYDESNFDYAYGVGFSTAHYRRLRAKHEMNDDLAGWFAQYQQEPIERDGAVFNPEHMKYYDDLPEGEPVKVIGHCDTALGGGDFVAFPIVYYYEDGSGYVEDVVFDNSEKHVTEPQVVAKIKLHKLKNVHFESNQGGEAYKEDVERMLKEDRNFNRGRPINITSDWAPVNKRKEQRIWDNAQSIRELYFKSPGKRDLQYGKFMQNLFSFTMVHSKRKHDDAADSLAALVDYEAHGSGVRVAAIHGSRF